MAAELTEGWSIFIDQYPQFTKLQRELAKTDWFVNDGWTAFIGYYHAGIYIQLFKPHWFNHTGDGIHLEMGITAETLAAKKTTIDLHVGHRNLFDRVRFNELTIAPMQEMVASWGNGVTFSKTNLSERMRVDVSFTKSGFPKQVTVAFTQMCQLGPIIDDSLKQLS